MKQKILILLCATLLAVACAEQQKQKPTYVPPATAVGDSTVYGLACDGCNDSILIFLRDPYDGSDPDTLDILNASKTHQVFGAIRIGDKVAAMRSTADSSQARLVIVTQDLMGQWCYKVKPTLRKRVGESEQSVEHYIAQLPDSLRQQMEVEREYGFTLKVDSVAMPIGMRLAASTTDEDSPLEYPPLRRYRQWCIRNGRLLLTETTLDSLGNTTAALTDTASLVMLAPDTLVLRFGDTLQHYYRKQESDQ